MKPMITGYVRIIKIPAGDAPREVREGWLGLLLPSYGQIEKDDTSRLLVSGDIFPSRRWSCVVPQKEAVEILEKNNPKAGAWFREHGFPKEGMVFTFGADEVHLEETAYSEV